MGAAIGGRHMPPEVTTIRTRRRTPEVITEVMAHLITTRLQEPTAGKRVRMVRMARRQQGRDTILTPELMREAVQCRPRMEVEALHRPITHTPGHMLRRDKDRVPTRNGAARICHEGTRALPWVITLARTEP